MLRIYLRVIYLFLFLLLISSCKRVQSPQDFSVRIIMTSDVHGLLFPYDFTNDIDAEGSLARVQSYVKQEREKSDREIILLDNGDILQGQPLVYYYNFEKSDSEHIIPSVMNYMGYDAATVGNHDIEAGGEVYDRVTEESRFPWLAGNIFIKGTETPYFKPYTIIDVRGVRVAIMGLTTPMVTEWLPEKLWEGMEFNDMLSAARKWMRVIDEEENADLVIGLFHEDPIIEQGDNFSASVALEDGSGHVAANVPGFDVIMTGHDHRIWNTRIAGPQNDTVLLIGPGSQARNIAVVTVDFEYDAGKGSYNKQITGEIVAMSDFEPDQDMLSLYENEISEVMDYVSRPIGRVSSTFSSRESLFGSSAFVDIIHRLQLELTGADISFAAPLSFDAVINEGDIRIRDLFNLYRFENYLYTMELSGSEIEGYLEYSYGNWFNRMEDEGDLLLRYRTDSSGNPFILDNGSTYSLAGPAFDFDSADGIDYVVDVSRPAGERVTILSMSNGESFLPENNYTVAINSYRGSGGGGHLENGAGVPRSNFAARLTGSTERDLRHYLMMWIEEKGIIYPRASNNWKVIPEDWKQKAMEREMILLFGD